MDKRCAKCGQLTKQQGASTMRCQSMACSSVLLAERDQARFFMESQLQTMDRPVCREGRQVQGPLGRPYAVPPPGSFLEDVTKNRRERMFLG